MDVQSRRGFVRRGVADEHHLQPVGKLQSSVNPFVLGGANDVIHHHFYGRVSHSERRGRHQPAGEGETQFCFSQDSVLRSAGALEPGDVRDVCRDAFAATCRFDLHVNHAQIASVESEMCSRQSNISFIV